MAVDAEPLGWVNPDVARTTATATSSWPASGSSCHDIGAASMALWLYITYAMATGSSYTMDARSDAIRPATCIHIQSNRTTAILRPSPTHAGFQHHVPDTTILE
jgi:hypothetical protein